MKIALVGQPNGGKSTIFNAVAGYKAEVANYPGKTVETLSSRVVLDGIPFEVLDLPGLYSLSNPPAEEAAARDLLLHARPDGIVHVVDAVVLCRSLELTLELLELGIPLVVALNMMDEAGRKGIEIDAPGLSAALGVPVVPTVASRGRGIEELFRAALGAAASGKAARPPDRSPRVEAALEALREAGLEKAAASAGLPPRSLALHLLEGDEALEADAGRADPALLEKARSLREALASCGGKPADVLLSAERHGLSVGLFERVAKVRRVSRRAIRDRADHFTTHPFWGYVILAGVLAGLFELVFGLGKHAEEPLLALFAAVESGLERALDPASLPAALLAGVLQGFSGGVAIVLPYLVPFLLGLSILEDVGYVPRAAFLMDSFMHRIGLHGKAVIPFVLGYGCTVPAIMGTKVLESPRDRFLAATLVNFIPCAARSTVVFALVGFALGPLPALGLYVLNLFVVAAAGMLLVRLRPEASPGMILELPGYKVPSPLSVARKVWFRLREFIVVAWPILIAGSVALSLLKFYGLTGAVDGLLAPFTRGVLGLPEATGVPLVFGILRKELTVVMLVQALGTSDFPAAMSTVQLVVFTVFTMFYVPCLATLAMMRVVAGARAMLFSLALTTAVAAALALAFRAAFALLG
ncbi:MAG: ferrous iron transport protein B [Planctomycetes bacterium]|nr:ferrous iron transport protein B [Planctomycetota bacterium]